MSKARMIGVAMVVPVSGFLWARAASREGSIAGVLFYAIAGTLSGLALTWIAREFALLDCTRRIASTSATLGFLFLTPLISMLIDESADPSNTSSIVLAFAAAGAAALVGALWSVLRLAGEAFDEWRDETPLTQENQS
jgi:hypothetical protein